MKKKYLIQLLLVISIFLIPTCYANSFNLKELYLINEKNFTFNVNDNTKIVVYFEPQYENIAKNITKRIIETHNIYEKLLGKPENFTLTIKLINQKDFFNITKIPTWINAIYFKKHIIFPMENNSNEFNTELLKSLRHEYMHAFINNLSNGNCASWFDEGLAQWAEGKTNPKLWSELEKFLEVHYPLNLNNLESSYTTLPTYLVPVAYAESLFGIKYLINNTNIENFNKLFSLLKNGISFNESFYMSFNLSIENFDYQISNILHKWKNTQNKKTFDEFINFSKSNNFEFIMARIRH